MIKKVKDKSQTEPKNLQQEPGKKASVMPFLVFHKFPQWLCLHGINWYKTYPTHRTGRCKKASIYIKHNTAIYLDA